MQSASSKEKSGNKVSDEKHKLPFKKRLILSALCGFLISFTVCIYGVLDIYLNNSDQFTFYLGDFIGSLVLYGILSFAVITIFISVFRGNAFYIVFSTFFWIAVMLYVQGNFLNFGMTSLKGDGVDGTNKAYVIINILLWIISGAVNVFVALHIKNKRRVINVFSLIMLTIIGMQLTSCAVSLVPKAVSDTLEQTESSSDTLSEGEPNETVKEETTQIDNENLGNKESTILTKKGLFEVSNKQNIIIFLFDRFDATYLDELLSDDPNFLTPLDGFTGYRDYTSLYSRTYPAVASMITGIDHDFSDNAEIYFNRAYGTSPFLKDLINNNYKIKLYTISYYAYRENTIFSGIADNESRTKEYDVRDEALLTLRMISLSAYRYLPNVLKEKINATSTAFSEFIDFRGDFPKYEKDDAGFFKELKAKGLTFQSDDTNNYIFIHMQGCHPPYMIDEDGNPADDDVDESREDRISALKGCFNAVYEYIDCLKELGVYEDSTIVIAGDHSFSHNIRKDVFNPRLTGMFVKYRGEAGTELRFSEAPVSQDNLIATIVESEGIKTENDYGKSFKDISESDYDNVKRRYFYLKHMFPIGDDELVEYEITGDGRNFDNWEEVNRTSIGRVYK